MSNRRLLIAILHGLGAGTAFHLSELFSMVSLNDAPSHRVRASWRANQDRIDSYSNIRAHEGMPRGHGFAPPQRPAKKKGLLRSPGKFY